MTPREKLGAELRRLRIAAGLRQSDIAEALGYSSAQFISNWERGVSQPPFEVAPVVAPLLGIRPLELVAMVFDAERECLDVRQRHVLKEMREELRA